MCGLRLIGQVASDWVSMAVLDYHAFMDDRLGLPPDSDDEVCLDWRPGKSQGSSGSGSQPERGLGGSGSQPERPGSQPEGSNAFEIFQPKLKGDGSGKGGKHSGPYPRPPFPRTPVGRPDGMPWSSWAPSTPRLGWLPRPPSSEVPSTPSLDRVVESFD